MAVVLHLFLPDLMSIINPKDSKFIGLVLKGNGDLRMRFGDSINWRKMKPKDKIYSQTYLFTGPQSSAIYGFLDESTISLGENSLIFMDFAFDSEGRRSGDGEDSISLELVDGEMQINLKDKSSVKKIKVEDTMIDISKQQKTVIKLNYEDKKGLDIAVIQGDIDIKQKKLSYKVKQGEKVEIENSDTQPVPEALDEQTMAEIKKLAQEDNKKTIEELKKKRELINIIQSFVENFQTDIEP